MGDLICKSAIAWDWVYDESVFNDVIDQMTQRAEGAGLILSSLVWTAGVQEPGHAYFVQARATKGEPLVMGDRPDDRSAKRGTSGPVDAPRTADCITGHKKCRASPDLHRLQSCPLNIPRRRPHD